MAATSRRRADTPVRRAFRRTAWVVGGLAVLAFAIEGGEYGTRDLLRTKARRAAAEAELAELRAEVDSLRAELEEIRTDPDRLEAIAREQHGMVKGDRELVYTVQRPGVPAADSGGVDSGLPPANF